jgi:hypothetical protein
MLNGSHSKSGIHGGKTVPSPSPILMKGMSVIVSPTGKLKMKTSPLNLTRYLVSIQTCQTGMRVHQAEHITANITIFSTCWPFSKLLYAASLDDEQGHDSLLTRRTEAAQISAPGEYSIYDSEIAFI